MGAVLHNYLFAGCYNTKQSGLERQCDGLMCLLARREMMMMTMRSTVIIIMLSYKYLFFLFGSRISYVSGKRPGNQYNLSLGAWSSTQAISS